MSGPDYSFEQQALAGGAQWVAGVDEVGRGCLAGPVVVAAVILRADHVPEGLADSKILSKPKREAAFERILQQASAISVCASSAREIDRVNIRQATLAAMRRAVLALNLPAGHELERGHVLIDGRDVPPRLPCPAQALIKGDNRSVSIAAASIIAKIMRDRLMNNLDTHFPHYGFAQHVGYGTAQHLAAIAAFGATPYHRLSFAPLKTS